MSKSKKRLKFAIVGCGRIAQRHAEHIHRLGNLVAACDIEINKAHVLADKYDATPFSELEEMLEATEIDVVSVCSPNGLHAEHTIRSLRANCHVLCEKPMALSAKDCGAMIPATQHAYRKPRIGKIRPDGQFDIVWEAKSPLKPEPYPASRQASAWRAALHDLHRGWENQWSAPLPAKNKPKK